VLGDPEPHVRAWAIQLLAEDRAPSAAALAKFVQLARDDRSPVVRLYLASALQRLNHSDRWSIAGELMMHAEDAGDHNLPKMTWLGVEPLVAENPAQALDYASRASIPLLAQFIARRTVDANALAPLVTAIGRNPKTVASLLEGMRDGLDGRFDVAAPTEWATVYDRLRRADGAVASLAREIADQFGDTEAARQYLATVRRSTAALDERRRALQILTSQRRAQLLSELPALLDDQALRADAIRAVAAFDDEKLGRLLIDRYRTFSAAEKLEAVQTLASRPRYGRMLTEALANQSIPRADVPVHVSRQLLRVVGAKFVEVWGPIERSATVEKEYARYRALLNDTAMSGANLQNGRGVYQRTCGACHKLHSEGGEIGPDLTGSNRPNLNYLLLNVLEPNAEVPDAYKMVVLTTRDGRTFTGNVVAETDRQITLRVVGRDAVAIDKSSVQSREATAVSMMPAGLLDELTDRDVVDLVGYLQRSGSR
jgi:putative heme-binding domain-containing protein